MTRYTRHRPFGIGADCFFLPRVLEVPIDQEYRFGIALDLGVVGGLVVFLDEHA